MAKEYSPLKLIKNTVYPSYQLYATAESSRLTSDEVLKVCVLETLFWIRQKFENLEIPDEIKSPSPSQYESFSLGDLKTFRLERGYIVDVVYVESKKIWSFQLVEPDLATSVRTPVPGRVFTTDISFSIEDNSVRCAFRTLVSEPENCNEGVLSLRNGVIKRLVRNPHIKLYQNLLQLNEKPVILNSESKIKNLKDNIELNTRTLPLIVFAEYNDVINSEADNCSKKVDISNMKLSVQDKLSFSSCSLYSGSSLKLNDISVEINSESKKKKNMVIKKELPKSKQSSKEFPVEKNTKESSENKSYYLYDLNDLAVDFMGYAVIYGLAYDKIPEFAKILKNEINPGDIVIFEPRSYGDRIVYRYSENSEANLNSIKKLKDSYHIKKRVDFNDYYFVSESRLIQQEELLSKCNTLGEMLLVRTELTKELETMKSANKELNEYKAKAIQFGDKLETANANIDKLKQLLFKQKELLEQEKNNKTEREKQLQIQVDYYQSLDNRPKYPKELPSWIRKEFPNSIVLHKKAEDMLIKINSFPEGYMKKLCDALEYLGKEYYMYYYSKEITQSNAALYASLKYNQQFQVTPSSDVSIRFLPSEYKIKYDKKDGNGRKEYPLDIHLKSGTDSEHLIRIYFNYDEYNRKIVIGSLPKHLPTVSQK